MNVRTANRGAHLPARDIALLASTGAVCVAVTVLTALATSEAAPSPGLPSPGTVVSAGLPLIQGSVLVAGTVVLALLLAVLLSEPDDSRGRLSAAAQRRCRAAAAGTTVLVVLLAARGAWTVANIGGVGIATAFAEGIRLDLWLLPPVRTLLVLLVAGTTATVLLLRARTLTAVGVVAGIVGLALVLPSVVGHASTSAAHGWLLLASPLHAAASILWLASVGAVLVSLRGGASAREVLRGTRALTTAVGVLVASGVVLAVAQLSSPMDLWSTWYGRTVGIKVALLAAAASMGIMVRGRLVRAAGADAPPRARLATVVAVEAIGLASAMVLGSILASSPAPRLPEPFATIAERLAGFSFPPPPTIANVALTLAVDPVFLAMALGLAGAYAVGVIRLLRRGDRWPWGRTIAWMLGVLAFAWLTNSGLGRYANITPGLHMGQHMGLTMLVPVLLVLGAPATLALRALRPSPVDRWGPREWLVTALHSRVLAVVTNPVVVLAIYFSGLYGLYLSNAFSILMSSHQGHILMQVHFVLSGYLFYWILIGVDPQPRSLPYGMRFFILIIASAFHGFFAVAMMMSTEPLAPSWFAVVRPPWIDDLLQDTINGGQAAWAIGEFPLAIVAIALAVQWARSDERDARRSDRKADRDGDRDLLAYNTYLASLSRRPGSSSQSVER